MYYKGLNEDGSCFHGGVGSWPLPTRNEDGTWTPGAWVEVEGNIEACSNGLHACQDGQVLEWLGPAMFELEYNGEPTDAGDKVVGRKARLLRRFETWNDRTARLFACDCAERVLPIYERDYPNDIRPRAAIETARRYANGEATKEELAAARDAAWVAAQAAAWAAAWGAAGDAAWFAARDAARDAASDVALYAASDAAGDAARAAASDAAGDAARAAASDAAWFAARDAAWDAARAAAWAAERAWQFRRLCEYLEG